MEGDATHYKLAIKEALKNFKKAREQKAKKFRRQSFGVNAMRAMQTANNRKRSSHDKA